MCYTFISSQRINDGPRYSTLTSVMPLILFKALWNFFSMIIIIHSLPLSVSHSHSLFLSLFFSYPNRLTSLHSVSPSQRSTVLKVTFSGSTRPSRRRVQRESSPHSNLQSHWTPPCQNFSDFCHESPLTRYSGNSIISSSF